MIELCKYKRTLRMHDLVSTHIYMAQSEWGARVYKIKTLCSNVAPEEGGGCIIEQVRYMYLYTIDSVNWSELE